MSLRAPVSLVLHRHRVIPAETANGRDLQTSFVRSPGQAKTIYADTAPRIHHRNVTITIIVQCAYCTDAKLCASADNNVHVVSMGRNLVGGNGCFPENASSLPSLLLSSSSSLLVVYAHAQ